MKSVKSYLRFSFVIALLSVSILSSAQSINVTGVVYDGDNDEPLIGVTVIKASGEGTITDIDGNFFISVATGEQLTFSFIGYKAQTVTVDSERQLSIVLESDVELLGEVIAIGYGVQKKEDKTGAVFSVTSDELQTVAVQDPIESLQGKVAGVTIRKGGSDPNAGFEVKIRGASGLESGTDPLYVVDGVAGVDATTISPDDIQSINVLKDASSAAIYGSRGANGVIIITTKRGVSGKSVIEYNGYVTMDQVSPAAKLDMMSADEYRAYGLETGTAIRDLGYNTDWQDEIYRTGVTQNHNVSLSGGNEQGTYRASVSHNDMEGLIKNSGKTRTIMRLNAQTKAFDDKLKLTMNLSNTLEHNDYVNYGSSGSDGSLFQAFQRNPTLPVYNEDGSYYQDPTVPVNNYSNPVAIINDIQNERDAKRLLANVKAELDIIEGLKLTVNGAYTRDDQETFYFTPAANTTLGSGGGTRQYDNNYSKLFESFMSYTRDFELHNFSAVAGYSHQIFGWDGFKASGEQPGSDITESNDLGSMANVVPGSIDSWKGESKLISGFGRVAYNYDHKYFATATLRRDGSSRFGDNNEWGLFPSGSLAWNMKREFFLEDVEVLNSAKLRFGYGQTGNQEIGTYKDIILWGVTGYTLDPETNAYSVDYGALQNANPDLKWEVNTEINVGIDFGLFESRLTGSVDYYNKKTTDLIYTYTVLVPPNLVSTTLKNGGAIDVNGIEAVLSGFIIDKSRFKWNSTLTVSHDKAIVKDLGDVDDVLEGELREPLGYGNYTQVLKVGEERGTFYGPKFAGVRASDGEFLYMKADGSYRTYDAINKTDYQILGTAQPKLEVGWSNFMTFNEHWDANFLIRGMFGHEILNATEMVFGNPNYFPTRNVLASAPDNSDLNGPSVFSDYFLEKGDFVRLENVTVGYKFDTSNQKWLGKARLYVAANNLFTLTKYKGIDPSAIGVDLFNVYPKSRSFTIGLNASF